MTRVTERVGLPSLPSLRHFVTLVVLALTLSACAAISQAPSVPDPSLVTPVTRHWVGGGGGYSGMTWMGGDEYLVVHDTKIHRDDSRLGVITVGGEEGVRYRALTVEDWGHADGRSSDLESVCALPGHPGEFLAAESGTWEGDFGRLFHLRLDGNAAEVSRAERLPDLADNDPETQGDNFEGIACAGRTDGSVLVILGERGGTRLNSNGSLRWAVYDVDGHSLAWSDQRLSISAPGAWISLQTKRDIADLHLDQDGTLWSVASEDAGDDGPFRSAVWAVGRVDPDGEPPVEIFADPPIGWWLDGLKVESLAAPPAHLPFAQMSVGTEDENLGGVWRPLYPTAAELPR